MSTLNTSEERTVVIRDHMKDDEAKDGMRGAIDSTKAFLNIPDCVPKFVQWQGRAMDAEFTIQGSDIIFHFFHKDMPGDKPVREAVIRPESMTVPKWQEAFPTLLDESARNYFRAEYPRLMARFTGELQSWWLKAQGFGLALAPAALAEGYLELLDSRAASLLPPAAAEIRH
jgi:hypothetical protein